MTLNADNYIETLLHDLFEDEPECQQQPQGMLPCTLSQELQVLAGSSQQELPGA
jgi:hypothetical protein